MSFFLRRVTFARWQGRSPITDEDRAGARGDFRLGKGDTDGLSLFEGEAEGDRQLVVAAIACGRMKVDKVDLFEITDVELKAFGVVVATPGGYPIARANRLHRSLPWDPVTLDALADFLLALGRRAVRHRTPEVKAALRELALEDVESGPCRDWVASLKATQ